MRISIIDAREGMRVARNIYDRDGTALLKKGVRLTESLIQSLKKRGIFAIEIEEKKDISKEADSKLDKVLKCQDLPVKGAKR
ncbi:MAG TPA: hypothetical protein GXX59_10845 [Syntrophomonadaceae bacterium]|nr:hypothetical protein [Syntrophomonadaceae bacterium]